MKKLLFTIVLGGLVAFTSCGKDECECVTAGLATTYTEDDIPPANSSLSLKEYCTIMDGAQQSPNKCEMR